ncbi:MAG: hypothetical protein KF908_09645 [Nitrosomonas sp.]|nr:hypothetical protein [Nitrosomonas sp.]MCW5607692.1 hypothetical protein [Nitrosomonas sp.]
MFKKLFFAALLSVSMLSFAEPDKGLEPSPIPTQQNQPSVDAAPQSRLKSILSNQKQNSAAQQQDSNTDQKPSMIDYCRKHTC